MIRFNNIPNDIYQKIDLLAEAMQNKQNIVFMYLFGGLVNKKQGPLSDVDIAVYVRNIKSFNYVETFMMITDILGTDEIDLVILNTAPISLSGRIVQQRKVLLDKNPFQRHKYESLTLRKYFDFNIKEKDIVYRRYGIG